MFNNIGLKLKVFFFIFTVFSLLSLSDFYLFDDVLKQIQLQQGPKNTYSYMESTLANEQFKLIAQAFKDSRTVTLKRAATKKALPLLDTHNIDEKSLFALTDSNGVVVGSNTPSLNNLKGVPAVDRALTQGIASDGIMSIKGKMFLIGVIPFTLQQKRKTHFFTLVEMKPVMQILKSFPFTFPIRAYFNNKMVYQTEDDDWSAIFPAARKTLYTTSEKKLLSENGTVNISRWTMLTSHSLPADFRSTSKITIIGLLSYTPGFAAWKDMVYAMIMYGIIAAFISLLFVFIVTHEIDAVFRKLSASLAELKVGEKIVSKQKYGHGAGMVVAALNTLISKYIANTTAKISQQGTMDEDFTSPTPTIEETSNAGLESLQDNFTSLASDMSTEKQEDAISSTTDTDFSKEDSLEDDENEKTMVAEMPIFPPTETLSPIDQLWNDYRSIKVANGHRVAASEKTTFINKLKSKKIAIIAQYDCRDVLFSIEEKAGKPVIKAKKIT